MTCFAPLFTFWGPALLFCQTLACLLLRAFQSTGTKVASEVLFPLCCRNSEIYNHVELKERYLKGVHIVKDSKSDSAIIGHMYEVRLAFPHWLEWVLVSTVYTMRQLNHEMCAVLSVCCLLVMQPLAWGCVRMESQRAGQ